MVNKGNASTRSKTQIKNNIDWRIRVTRDSKLLVRGWFGTTVLK